MKTYKLVIFDFDGTLADSFPWFLKTINAVALRYHFKQIDPEQIDNLRALSGRELMAHLGIPWWKLPFVANAMRRSMKQQVGAIKPFAGVDKLLYDLHGAGIEIAIVTSNSQENVQAVLTPETLSLVSTLSCGAAMYGKQARFRQVLRKHGCSPADALSVGDEIRDAEASTASGIDFLGVAWGFTKPEALQKHTNKVICTNFDELLAVAKGASHGGN